MTSSDTDTQTICVLGVAGSETAVELYGVNVAREVTVHGWFQQSESFMVLANRPLCLIAVDAGALPCEFVDELRRLGHEVVIMPVPRSGGRASYRRTARDVCQLAVGLADVNCGSQGQMLQ